MRFFYRSVSTTIDPFWDISLDLGNVDHSNGNGKSSSGASAASTPEPTIPGKELLYRQQVWEINNVGRFRMLNLSIYFNCLSSPSGLQHSHFVPWEWLMAKDLFWEWNRLFQTDWSSWTVLTNNVNHPGFHIHCKQYLSLLRFSGGVHARSILVPSVTHVVILCLLFVVWVPHCRWGYSRNVVQFLFLLLELKIKKKYVFVNWLCFFVSRCAEEIGQSQLTEDSSHHDESFVPKSLVDCLRR